MRTKANPLMRCLSLIAVLGAAAIGLTACSQLTLEEAKSSSHKIIETGYDFWEGYQWSYIGPDGKELPLTVDCSDFWKGSCRKSPDGLIEFHYSKTKSGISSERMTIDGAEWKLECLREDSWDGDYICAPIE